MTAPLICMERIRDSGKVFVFGIAGDSGSGKTTISKGIRRILGEEMVATFSMDDYHCLNRKQRKERNITPLHPAANQFELLADHLLASGWAVRCAGNGVEALSEVAQAEGGIGLVLLDLRMPVMDGFECARRLAAMPEPRVPVVIMTAEHETRRVERLPGVVTVLYKPLDVTRLDALIEANVRA